jgi:hypothetical protein
MMKRGTPTRRAVNSSLSIVFALRSVTRDSCGKITWKRRFDERGEVKRVERKVFCSGVVVEESTRAKIQEPQGKDS